MADMRVEQLTMFAYWDRNDLDEQEMMADIEAENAKLGDFPDYEQMRKDTLMLNEYQQRIEDFITTTGEVRMVENVLGLTGEAGEFCEKFKKYVRDGELDKEGALKELGDVLFYVAALATYLDVDLSEVADMNINKLLDRKARNVINGEGDYR